MAREMDNPPGRRPRMQLTCCRRSVRGATGIRQHRFMDDCAKGEKDLYAHSPVTGSRRRRRARPGRSDEGGTRGDRAVGPEEIPAALTRPASNTGVNSWPIAGHCRPVFDEHAQSHQLVLAMSCSSRFRTRLLDDNYAALIRRHATTKSVGAFRGTCAREGSDDCDEHDRLLIKNWRVNSYRFFCALRTNATAMARWRRAAPRRARYFALR